MLVWILSSQLQSDPALFWDVINVLFFTACPGAPACSGRGSCNDTVGGDGTCTCQVRLQIIIIYTLILNVVTDLWAWQWIWDRFASMKKQLNIIKNSLLAQTTMIDDRLQSIVGNFNSIHYIQYSQTCIRQSPLGNGLVTS